MAVLQFSDTLRNNRLNQLESTLGTAPKLQIRSGTKPASVADIDIGTLLCEITLPSDWMNAAASGIKTKNGTWTGTAGVGAGAGTMAGHFRMKNNAGTLVHLQGDISVTGGGGALTLNDTNIVAGQPVTVTAFTLTDGNI